MNRLSRMPFFVQLMLISGMMMMVPATYGAAVGQNADSRAFFYSSILFIVLSCFIAIARYRPEKTADRSSRRERYREARNQLTVLLMAYTVLPLILAVPFAEATGNTRFFNAYVEMVSAMTTTGATLFDDPDRLSRTVHLWRAVVGWMGGLFAWVTAIAVLAPINLGGFEVISARHQNRETAAAQSVSQIVQIAAGPERLARYTARLLPVYVGLTLALWLALTMVGSSPYVALCHAMSTLATSGISPVGGLEGSGGGFAVELLIFAFLFLALSRKTFLADDLNRNSAPLHRDPEMKIALTLLFLLPAAIFLRHWVGAFEVESVWDIGAAFASLWGGLFMTLSFLTTSGFESTSWEAARAWSGLETPSVILMGLAIFGGGVATTAGGVKLMRLYALVRHGEREIEKLISPNSVGGAGAQARRIRREGAYVAWVYFMVFAFTLAAVMCALSLYGLTFEAATTFAIAALTTTGPLVNVASSVPLSYVDLPDGAKAILAATMVLGRLEMLAMIALFNPEFWR